MCAAFYGRSALPRAKTSSAAGERAPEGRTSGRARSSNSSGPRRCRQDSSRRLADMSGGLGRRTAGPRAGRAARSSDGRSGVAAVEARAAPLEAELTTTSRPPEKVASPPMAGRGESRTASAAPQPIRGALRIQFGQTSSRTRCGGRLRGRRHGRLRGLARRLRPVDHNRSRRRPDHPLRAPFEDGSLGRSASCAGTTDRSGRLDGPLDGAAPTLRGAAERRGRQPARLHVRARRDYGDRVGGRRELTGFSA